MKEDSQANLARLKNIKLLILDVDGVLTDGKLYFDANGEQLKVFNSLDGLGIKMLRDTGVEVGIITARQTAALEQRCTNLGIRHLYQGRQDKLVALEELLAQLGLTATEVAHLGDDLPDLPVIRKVGFGMAVSNAYPLVIEHARWCTSLPGGSGAVREACDFIMQAQGTLRSALSQYLEDEE